MKSGLVLGLIIALGAYTGLRLVYSSAHIRSYLEFNDSLHIAPGIYNDRARFGFGPDDVLVSVNGYSVDDRRSLEAVTSANRQPRLELVAVDASGSQKRSWWIEVPVQPRFSVTESNGAFSLEPIDPLVFADAPLGLGEHFSHVDALPIGQTISSADWEMSTREIGVEWPLSADSIRRIALRPTMRLSVDKDGEHVRDLVLFVIDWRAMWARLAIGVAFGLIGWGVFRLSSDTITARGFIVFAVSGAILWMARAVPYHYRFPWEKAAYLLAQVYFPFASLVLLITFTSLRRSAARRSLFLMAGFVICSLLIVADLIAAPEFVMTSGLLARPVIPLMLLVSAAILVLPVASRLVAAVRRSPVDVLDRQRDRAIIVASFLGFIPSMVYLFVRGNTGRWQEIGILIEFTVLLFPLVVGYGVVQQNLLRINELLRVSAVYGLCAVVVSVVYIAFVAGLSPLLERILPIGSGSINTILIVGLTLATLPLHAQVRRWLRERMLKVPATMDDFIVRLVREQSQSSSIDAFVDRVCSLLQRMLGSEKIETVLYYPNRNLPDWRMAQNEDTSGIERLVAYLADDALLFQAQLDDDPDLDEGQKSILRTMQDGRIALAMPLESHGERLGALLVGHKLDRTNFSRGEVRGLGRIQQELSFLVRSTLRQTSESSTRINVGEDGRVPEVIGRFGIERLLGRGGMALVYLGTSGGAQFAIKVPTYAITREPKLVERFRRECQVMSALSSPNIVRVDEISTDPPYLYIAEEYFARGTLDDLLKERGRLPATDARTLLRDAVRGLRDALDQGVIHRDIKPKNLFIADNGTLKIGDFGFAKRFEDSTITSIGEMFGTPHYMAPEIMRGEVADWRSDLYALGVTFYQMLVGRRPFEGQSVEEILYQQLSAAVPDVRAISMDVAEADALIISKTLAKRPHDRYASYAELLSEIDGVDSNVI